jgi:hypothetical protein
VKGARFHQFTTTLIVCFFIGEARVEADRPARPRPRPVGAPVPRVIQASAQAASRPAVRPASRPVDDLGLGVFAPVPVHREARVDIIQAQQRLNQIKENAWMELSSKHYKSRKRSRRKADLSERKWRELEAHKSLDEEWRLLTNELQFATTWSNQDAEDQ